MRKYTHQKQNSALLFPLVALGIGPRGYALGLLEKAAEGINRFKSQGLGNFAHAVFRGAQHIAGCLCQQLIFHFHRGLAHFCLEKPPQLGLAQIADFRQMRDGDFLPVMAADIGYRRLDFLPGRIGRRLYLALEDALKRQHIINMNACIAYTKDEDSHLTHGSVKFHERMGYSIVGHFSECGYKFGKWYDIVWMEKHLGPHPQTPQPVIPFAMLMDK